MVFEGFDRIRIINLPSRRDRRKEMVHQLSRIGLAGDPRVQFVDGILVKDKTPFRGHGEKGVFLAHLQILKEAAQAGESVLVLEDDVDFAAGAERWKRESSTDIAYGGYYASSPADLEHSDIAGAHCMGFSARAAQALVPFLEALLDHESPPPIDGAYVWFRRQRRGYTTAFANPVVAVQRSSRSDITPRRALDRVPILKGAMDAARRAKRRLLSGEITFGLREAVIVSLLGILIASAAAYHFTHVAAAGAGG